MTAAAVPASTTTRPIPKPAYAVPALLLLGAAVAAATSTGAWWAFAAGVLGPDAALILGAGAGLAQGRLHPRAVRPYNALHALPGPVALTAAGAVLGGAVLGGAVLAGGLAWCAHVVVDRALGYGLRAPDGSWR